MQHKLINFKTKIQKRLNGAASSCLEEIQYSWTHISRLITYVNCGGRFPTNWWAEKYQLLLTSEQLYFRIIANQYKNTTQSVINASRLYRPHHSAISEYLLESSSLAVYLYNSFRSAVEDFLLLSLFVTRTQGPCRFKKNQYQGISNQY